MKADFYVEVGTRWLWVTDADNQSVARFENNKHGRWAYHSFCYGCFLKGLRVFDVEGQNYISGSVADLVGEAA